MRATQVVHSIEMIDSLHPSYKRLLLAVLAAALLSVAFNVLESGSVPTGMEWATLGIGFVFATLMYGLFVSALYLGSVFISGGGLAGWVVFTAVFLGLSVAWSYHALSGYDALEIGGQTMVIKHQLTRSGWAYFERSSVQSAVMTAATALILFIRR